MLASIPCAFYCAGKGRNKHDAGHECGVLMSAQVFHLEKLVKSLTCAEGFVQILYSYIAPNQSATVNFFMLFAK